jgi:Ca-activated chloride channel family protein
MPEPKIEIIPIRNASRSDAPTTLDVLVRVVPPTPDVHFVRPTINLGLVLDRSGSMAGAKKMAYAREAASFAVQQLLPTDRVSVTTFDDKVATIAPNDLATNKPALVGLIGTIVPGNSTDLHAGWKEGADQVEAHLVGAGLNRVILLSDGLANHGVTDPNAIAAEVKGRAARGVSTTSMGLGDDYNEDLMQAVGESGDGNYYYIESPQQLADIFQTELQGLMANAGQKVSLGVEPQGGTELLEVLNDLSRNSLGRLMLSNLIVGMPIPVVVRLKVPPAAGRSEVCRFRLAWDDPKGGRLAIQASLSLGSCPSSEWDSLPTAPEVEEEVAMQRAARAKKEAIAAYDRGDLSHTVACVAQAREFLGAMPTTASVAHEREEIAKLEADLAEGEGTKFRKRGGHQAYLRKFGKGS